MVIVELQNQQKPTQTNDQNLAQTPQAHRKGVGSVVSGLVVVVVGVVVFDLAHEKTNLGDPNQQTQNQSDCCCHQKLSCKYYSFLTPCLPKDCQES